MTSATPLADMDTTVRQIVAYENGDLDDTETVALFTHLLHSGAIHHLQGHYQRTALHLLQAGRIPAQG